MENNLNFASLNEQDLDSLNGGGWGAAGSAFLGAVAIGLTPLACMAGPGAAGAVFVAGCAALDYACDNPNK